MVGRVSVEQLDILFIACKECGRASGRKGMGGEGGGGGGGRGKRGQEEKRENHLNDTCAREEGTVPTVVRQLFS